MFSAFQTFGRMGAAAPVHSTPAPPATALTADDGTTPLTADDGTTALTED